MARRAHPGPGGPALPPPATVRRRRLLAAPAAAAAGAAAAACAPGESPAPASSEREKTIIFDTDWLSGPRGDVVNRALAEWQQQNPKTHIDKRDVLTQAGTVFEKTATLIASDTLGDLMLWAGYLFVYYAKRDLYVDVGPYLRKHRISLDDRLYIPEHVIYQGKTYGFPFQFNAFDRLYNRSLFQSKGVKEPDDTWTWDTVLDAARRLTEPGKGVFGLGQPGGFYTSYFEEIMYAMGDEPRSKDDRKTLFDTPDAIEALTYAAELVTRHQVAPAPKVATAEKYSAANGNYAMWIGSASRAFDEVSVAGKFQWDLMYGPKWPKSGKRVVLQNDQPNVITRAAKKHDVVEETALFGAFLSGDFVQDVVSKYGNTIPVFKKKADSDDFLPASRWKRKIIMDGFSYRKSNQGAEFWYSWYRAVEAEMLKATNGESSPREAALAAARAGDAALAAQSLQPLA